MTCLQFEVGKYYKHASGQQIAIVATATTTMYGDTLLAEQSDRPDFKPVGFETDDSYEEITKEEWMENFSD
jgi:hypothetical protein